MTPKLEFGGRIGENSSHAEAATRDAETQIEPKQRIDLVLKQHTAAARDEGFDVRRSSPDRSPLGGPARRALSYRGGVMFNQKVPGSSNSEVLPWGSHSPMSLPARPITGRSGGNDQQLGEPRVMEIVHMAVIQVALRHP
jgi:hypothetical protein